MPPDISAGYLPAWPGRPTVRSSSSMRAGRSADGHAAGLQRQRDVARRGAPRQQRLAVILEHDRDLAARLAHRLAVESHLAAGRLVEPGRQPQRRGLAAAGGADDAEEFAGSDAEAEILDDGLAAELERDSRRTRPAARCPRRIDGIRGALRRLPWRQLSLPAGIDEVQRRAQMRFQHRLRARNVARDDAVGQQLVRAHEFLAAVERAHHHAAVAIGLVVEIGMGGQQALRAAGRPAARCESPCAAGRNPRRPRGIRRRCARCGGASGAAR